MRNTSLQCHLGIKMRKIAPSCRKKSRFTPTRGAFAVVVVEAEEVLAEGGDGGLMAAAREAAGAEK